MFDVSLVVYMSRSFLKGFDVSLLVRIRQCNMCENDT